MRMACVALPTCERIEAILREHGLTNDGHARACASTRMACVALPTCGLALAESERYLPDLVTALEEMLGRPGCATTRSSSA